MDEDRQAFLAAMAAAPEDEAPHRVFADWLDERGCDEEAAYHRRWTVKVAAEEWLRNYATAMNCYDDSPEKAFERLVEGLRDRELFAYGTDLHGLYELDSPDELKRQAEIYLSQPIDLTEFSFSCSC